ncbi:hypothetical protein AC249_AIPGENE7409 [Exaiptasia diaphana]|nr:hypothetical protein AC249_AIPGENE7409 [Exaiptasia diaphana]
MNITDTHLRTALGKVVCSSFGCHKKHQAHFLHSESKVAKCGRILFKQKELPKRSIIVQVGNAFRESVTLSLQRILSVDYAKLFHSFVVALEIIKL